MDPAAAAGWWEGWTASDPSVDGGVPGPAFHPLQAEIQSGSLAPAPAEACSTIDPGLLSGGTVDVFGETFPVCIVRGTLTTDQVWPNNHVFLLANTVTVGTGDRQLMGAAPSTSVELTIEAGTQVYASSDDTSLVVSRGSQIDARGTLDLPIVFSAVEGDENGITGDPEDLSDRGAWGGIVLSGFASTNLGDFFGELLSENVSIDGERWFGGTNDFDSSGRLRFVVIAESGLEMRPAQRMPGLSFEAVGSGTTVDLVQVTTGESDCFAWFGGTASAQRLMCNGPLDDGLDIDLGFRGALQFGVVRLGAAHGDRGIEIDNNGDNFEATPPTSPDIANFTLLGNAGERATTGVLTQEGSRERLFRSVIADDGLAGGAYDDGCFDVDDDLPADLQWRDIVTDCSPDTLAICEPDELLTP